MTKLWAICRTTFLQTIRQPIYGVLILVTFALLVVNVPLSGFTVSTDYHTTDQKMMTNLGLATLLVTGLLVAAFSATSAITREIETRTALTVVSKPVNRATFVLGKFLGVTVAVTLAYYLCSLVFLMTVRHKVMPAASDPYDWPVITLGVSALVLTLLIALAGNLMFSWTFTSAGVWTGTILLSLAMGIIAFVGKKWKVIPFGQDIGPEVLQAIFLLLLGVLIFVAVAVAASTRLGQVLTLAVCCGVFFLGSMHRSLFTAERMDIVVVKALSLVIPNLQVFHPFDTLMQGQMLTGGYVVMAVAYCLLYSFGVLAVAAALFQTHPMEAQGSSSTMPSLVNIVAWAGRASSLVLIFAGMILASLADFHTVKGVGLISALIAGGVLGWLVWGRFGRGTRGAYYIIWAVVLLALIRLPLAAWGPKALGWLTISGERSAHLILEAIALSAVLLVLILPKTRLHFRSENN